MSAVPVAERRIRRRGLGERDAVGVKVGGGRLRDQRADGVVHDQVGSRSPGGPGRAVGTQTLGDLDVLLDFVATTRGGPVSWGERMLLDAAVQDLRLRIDQTWRWAVQITRGWHRIRAALT